MAAEDFVISVDYWFPQRDATRKQLLTVAPVLHDEQQQRQKHQQRRRIEQN